MGGQELVGVVEGDGELHGFEDAKRELDLHLRLGAEKALLVALSSEKRSISYEIAPSSHG